MSPELARVIALFGSLNPDALDRLGEVYAPGARFRDPFNDVTGLPAIRTIMADMFEVLDGPRFEVVDHFEGPQGAMLTWDFIFRLRAGAPEHRIRGASHLQFDPAGMVCLHRDYWDASELYDRLPLVGLLSRWLRRRLKASG